MVHHTIRTKTACVGLNSVCRSSTPAPFVMDKKTNFDSVPAGATGVQQSLKINVDTATPTAIMVLRTATSATHQRLHAHPAFASLMRGKIGQAEYSALLLALYGFHKFYVGVSIDAPLRCGRLVDDLMVFSLEHVRAEQPPCLTLSAPMSHAEHWGVEYVLAGAAMGGKLLAGKLDHLLGERTQIGRSFFVGDGPARGSNWRDFVHMLEKALPTALDQSMAAKAALQTFEHFENCMNRVVAERTGRAT